MPKYGGVKSGFTLYGDQNNDTVYLIGQKAQPWNSVVALQSDSYETVSTTNYKSVPAAWTRPNTSAEANFVWRTAYASTPGSVAVTLQGAMDDVDAQYHDGRQQHIDGGRDAHHCQPFPILPSDLHDSAERWRDSFPRGGLNCGFAQGGCSPAVHRGHAEACGTRSAVRHLSPNRSSRQGHDRALLLAQCL